MLVCCGFGGKIKVKDEKDFSYCDNNRFRLVILASQRAHELSSGAMTFVARKDTKNTVIALREIADNQLDINAVFGLAVRRCRKYFEEFANPRCAISGIRQSSTRPSGPLTAKTNFKEKGEYPAFWDQDKFLSGRGGGIEGF